MFDIMIVDDTITNLKILSQILRDHGYKLRIIPNGVLALKAIEIQKPDLILLDIMMPQINGYELCKKLKEDKGTMDIPIIFISALSETEGIVASFKLGAVDYITKPFKTEEVIARVETQLKIIEANRKNRELLSKTFVGSVQIMTDILSTLKPELYINATKLTRKVIDFYYLKC